MTERVDTKRVRNVEKKIRRKMVEDVKEIYRVWGMTGDKFCEYLADELQMECDSVHKFLHSRKSMHKELVHERDLIEILDKIFDKYISTPDMDSISKRTINDTWMSKRAELIKPIEEYQEFFLVMKLYKVFVEVGDIIDSMPDLPDPELLEIFRGFIEGKWPDESKRGLSLEEVEKLRDATILVLTNDAFYY